MATAQQRDDLRADLDATIAAMSDVVVDRYFERATTEYGDNVSAVEASARLIAIRQLLSGAVKRVDYKQNQTSQSSSQYFKNLVELRKIYMEDLTQALSTANGIVRWGTLRKVPYPRISFPDGGYGYPDYPDWIEREF